MGLLLLAACGGSDDGGGSGSGGAGGSGGGSGGSAGSGATGGSGGSAGGGTGGTAAESGTGGAGAVGGAAGMGGGTGGTGATGPVCEAVTGAVDLTGQWAVQANLLVRIDGNAASLVLLCPNPQMQTASFTLKVDIAGSGANLTQVVSVCDLTLPTVTGGVGACPMDPSQAIETIIQLGPGLQALLPTITTAPIPATLSSSDAGVPYEPQPFAVMLGANLANPQSDPLPFWDTSKFNCGTLALGPQPSSCVVNFDKVIDEDTDGKPGVTLQATALTPQGTSVIDGDGYAVFRVAPALHGTVKNDRCIEGTLEANLEYSLVDSDIKLQGLPITTGAVLEQLPPFAVLPQSTFKMLRADGAGTNDFDDDGDGTVTCAEIRAHAAAFAQ